MTTTYTSRLRLPKPDFTAAPWHSLYYDAMEKLDSVISGILGDQNIVDWDNDTDFTVGQIVLDTDDTSMWLCVVAHTSDSAPTTFSEDRIANPTFWTLFSGAYQAQSDVLDALANLTGTLGADKLQYYTAADATGLTPLTSFGRSLIDDANAATARSTLGLVIGTNVQAWSAELDAIVALTTTAAGITILEMADAGSDKLTFWDDSAGRFASAAPNGSISISGTDIRIIETHSFALSDELTALTTGTNKLTFSLPYAFTVTGVYASLGTASSSGIPTVDINEAGVSILSTKLTIDANEKTSATAANAAVISDASIAANAEIGFDIDVAGTGAKGLKVVIQGYRTT